MPKSLNLFFCKECGYETIKWLGQCPSCKAWNSMVEAPKESKKRPGGSRNYASPEEGRGEKAGGNPFR